MSMSLLGRRRARTIPSEYLAYFKLLSVFSDGVGVACLMTSGAVISPSYPRGSEGISSTRLLPGAILTDPRGVRR
jgi:hypothetical protein